MTADNFLNRYLDILRKFTKQECSEIQLDEQMLNLGINSFDVIEILIALEEVFNVEFPDNIISPELFTSPQTLYNGLMVIISKKDKM